MARENFHLITDVISMAGLEEKVAAGWSGTMLPKMSTDPNLG